MVYLAWSVYSKLGHSIKPKELYTRSSTALEIMFSVSYGQIGWKTHFLQVWVKNLIHLVRLVTCLLSLSLCSFNNPKNRSSWFLELHKVELCVSYGQFSCFRPFLPESFKMKFIIKRWFIVAFYIITWPSRGFGIIKMHPVITMRDFSKIGHVSYSQAMWPYETLFRVLLKNFNNLWPNVSTQIKNMWKAFMHRN